VVTGYGTVDGRPVCVFSQDFTVFGGSLGEVYGEKIVKVMDLAMKTAARSSASTTAAARASRRAWSRSAATARSSAATCRPPA
jgi:acetyl-CoA carboxylase carboxyltransferase component